MAKYIDREKLIEGRVSNDPVVIAAKCAPTEDVVPAVRGEMGSKRHRLPLQHL